MNKHKNIGENHMSLPNSARRLSLMAGSSLVAAAFTAGLSAGVVMTPTAALAYDECAPTPASGTLTDGTNGVSDPTLNGAAAADSFTCSAGLYAGGTAYTSSGNLTVTTSTDAAEWGGAGIVLRNGQADDSITFTTTVEIEGRSLVGALLDVQTDDGAIVISTEEVDADAHSATGATGAIKAVSDTGDISITATGTVIISSGAASATAIQAQSAGGDIAISSTSTANQAFHGRLRGILAETTGAGTITIAHSGAIRADETNPNAVGLEINAGGGKVTVNAQGPLGGALGGATIGTFGPTASSFAGGAVKANYGGDAEFNFNHVIASGSPTGANWVVDLDTAAGTTTDINLFGRMGRGGQANSFDGNTRTLRVTGGGDVDLTVTGRLSGFLDLTDAGQLDLRVLDGGLWVFAGGSALGDEVDTVTIDAGGRMFAGVAPSGADVVDITTIDFGGGADVLDNAGVLIVGADWTTFDNPTINDSDIELRLSGLETFNNSGTIVLGGRGNFPGSGSDWQPDDILRMTGGTFFGEPGESLLLVDVNLNGEQAACDGALRDPVTLNMPAADCVRIENGATDGVTSVRVKEMVSGDRGSYGEIVLVDVSGGTSAAGHFVLDPGSDKYSAANGGVIDKGFFIFPLVYDADTQQHKLIAAPGQNAQQFPLVAQAAHGLWRVSTGSWLDRQADLRGDIDDGMGGGVWMRIATEFADRDAIQIIDIAGNPFSFDNTYAQSSYAVTGGLDILSGGAGATAWILGVTAGYAHSDMDFDASPNAMRLDGWTGGGYASFVSGGLFVDAVLNANKLELEGDVPGLGLIPAGTMVDTALLSVGGQVEAGWRFPVMEGAFVEPLAGVSYVRTKYDDMSIAADDPLRPPLVLEFDDPTSLRASLGARFGLDQDYGVVRAQYSLLGRVWNEFEGETRLIAHNTGADALIMDEFTGQFTEFGVGVSLFGLGEALSGFANFGGKFGDDYKSQNLSAGVRVNW